jgi:hypothetical protein
MEPFVGVRMANANKPSIFNDRRSIGSEKELDEYGVWVKSESEEFAVSEQDNAFETDFPPFVERGGSRTVDTSLSDPGIETVKASSANSDLTLSAALLFKIAEELASIKAELASLKSELDRARKDGAEPGSVPSAVPVSPPVSPPPSVPVSVADTLPAETEVAEEETVEEADFGDFEVEETFGEESFTEETADEQPSAEPSQAETTETGFFDNNETGDKIALTSDELDLLGEDANESVEEMEDTFFADDNDQEKIAFTGDEINDILGNVEIPAEPESYGGVKAEEITLEDIPEEPIIESQPLEPPAVEMAEARVERVPDEELPAEDDAFDINIESVEESMSESGDALTDLEADGEINLDEDTFDIDIDIDSDIDDDLPEEKPETTADLDDAAVGINTDTEDGGLMEPQTADIAFDPFGSLPDEDVVDADISDIEDEIIAESPAVESVVTGKTTSAAEYDTFADAPAGEKPVLNKTLDQAVTAETTETEEVFLADKTPSSEDAETVEIEEAVFEDSFEPKEDNEDEETVAGIEADPVLSKLLDENIRQSAPAPDDTSYLDDEKLPKFDEVAESEATEALVPLLEEPDTSSAPVGEESPALKGVPQEFKQELRTVLSYMDILLESLPEEKIEEFARSEHFEPYKKLFKELGLV